MGMAYNEPRRQIQRARSQSAIHARSKSRSEYAPEAAQGYSEVRRGESRQEGPTVPSAADEAMAREEIDRPTAMGAAALQGQESGGPDQGAQQAHEAEQADQDRQMEDQGCES